MITSYFPHFAILSAALLIIGNILAFFDKKIAKKLADILIITGLLAQATFIFFLWNHIDRPPMRTLGETRLWYTFFLILVGFITYKRWKYAWFMSICFLYSFIFLFLNLIHPENFDKNIMPALQSYWFPLHVIVYMIAYATLGISCLVAVAGLYQLYSQSYKETFINMADNLVYIGFAFLTMGLLFGALWAKEAWGHYWTWDPKETWAFLTWLSYLIYIHIRYRHPEFKKGALWTLAFAFIILMIAYYGVNYLPSAQNSVHVYAKQS